MALEDQLQEQQSPQEMTDDQEQDLSIAVNIAKNLIDDGGWDIIEQALASKDPGQIIGQFLMQLVAQMTENLPEEVDIDPAIYLAIGGWVEQISDYLQEEYDVPKEVMDRAEMYIGTASQQMLQGQQQQQAQMEQAAPMPQQATGVM